MVYGSMPFDGSDCRKLRKQISTGTYFEPPRYSGKQSTACSELALSHTDKCVRNFRYFGNETRQ